MRINYKWVKGEVQMNGKRLALIFCCTVLLLSACAKENPRGAETNAEQNKPPEPVTLKMYQSGAYFTDQDFQLLFVEPLKNKYPHITLENVVSKMDLPELIASGEPVDFFVTWNGRLPYYKDFEFYEDLIPLANKYGFDLGKFDPKALDAIKAVSDKGELYALPYAVNLNATYYNKDIFDKFGVPYPQDGMTWEDAIELAKRVTREDGGISYQGLDMDSLNRLFFPLSLNVIDGKTDKPNVNNEFYKRAFEIGKQIYTIPGNPYRGGGEGVYNRFLKDKTLAMLMTVNLFLRLKEIPDLNWDVAQFPSYKERPNTYGMYDLHIIIPSKISKHQEDMMRVMEVLFSDEVQTAMVKKTLRVSVMKDPKYNQMFGQDIPELKNKRLTSIFKSSPAPAPAYSKYYPSAINMVVDGFKDYVNGKKDVNTALRETEEKILQYIRENP